MSIQLQNRLDRPVDERRSHSLKGLQNAFCTISFVGTTTLMVYQMQQARPDMIMAALSSVGVGFSERTFRHINFDKCFPVFQKLNDISARWSLFAFEAGWQAFLNIDNDTAEIVLLCLLGIQYGDQIANDFFNLITQKKGSRAYHLLNDKNLNSPEVNYGTGFTLNSPKKRIAFHSVLVTSGIALTTLGYLTDYAPSILPSAGCFLGSFGLGAILTQLVLAQRQKKVADTELYIIPSLDEVGTIRLSKKERAWRLLAKTGQLCGKEALIATALIAQNYFPHLFVSASLVAGLGTGAIYTINQVTFGKGLTKEVYLAQQAQNTHENARGKIVRNKELVLETAFTGLAALGVPAYFTWGAINSYWNERTGIILFLLGTYGAGLLTFLAELFFEPGKSNVIFNFLRYFLFENSFLLPMGYLFLATITGITDAALMLDSSSTLIIGFIALFTFGLFFGNVSVLNLSKNRPTNPSYASAAYRYRGAFRIAQMLMGQLSPSNIPSI